MGLKKIFSRKEGDPVPESSALLGPPRSYAHASSSPMTLQSCLEDLTLLRRSGTGSFGQGSRHNAVVNYWARAASELQSENPTAAKVLTQVQELSSSDHGDVIDLLREETDIRRKELEQKRWRLKLGGKTIVLHDLLARISQAAQAFKDLGGPLTSIDPIHAGLPWAGICFLMQLTLSDADQYSALLSATEEVAVLMNRYQHVEYICQRRPDVSLRQDFENLLVKLYRHILEFQIAAACYYRRNTLVRYLRSPLGLDNVSDTLKSIRDADSACRALGEVFDTNDDILRHSELLALLKTSKETLDQMMSKMSNALTLRAQNQERTLSVPFAFDIDPKFTGRADIIERLDASFQIFRRVALLGWAGVGKSQIAIEYAHRFRKKSVSNKIFWVRGARPDVFIQSYRDIARKLQLPGCDDVEGNSSEILYDWLCDSTNGDWLMVLDNVDDETVFSSTGASTTPTTEIVTKFHGLQKYLPQVSHGSILVTSRNRVAARDITNEADCIIIVGRMPDEDAISLLRKKLPSDKSPEKDFRDLLASLENLPLAITQAAAYIGKSSRMTLSRYLSLFRLNETHYLENAANDIRRDPQGTDGDFSNSVLKTWFISFNHIRSQHPDAAEWLCFMSLIFGQGIPVEYLLCGDVVNHQVVEDTIEPLIEFELITEEKDGLYSIHRLVQLSVRSWLTYNNELFQSIEMAAKVLEHRFRDPSPEVASVDEHVIPHVEIVASYKFSTLDGLNNQSLLLIASGSYYDMKENSALAVERYTQARQIIEEHFKDELHPTHFRLKVYMIYLRRNLGEHIEAEASARALHEMTSKTLEIWDLRRLKTATLLGQTLTDSGKYSEAETFIREALQMAEQYLPKNDNRTLDILARLAFLQNTTSEFSASCEMMKTVVERSLETNGRLDILTLSFMFLYGLSLMNAGRVDEAEHVLRENLEDKTTSLSENSPQTIAAMAYYALALIGNEKLVEAEYWNEKALALIRTNNQDGGTIILLYDNKGHILKQNDELHEAQKYLEKAIIFKRQRFGATHPETLMSMLTACQCEIAGDSFQAADQNLNNIYQEFEKQLGQNDWRTLAALRTLTRLRRSQGRKKESISLAKECLARSQQAFGLESVLTINFQISLATALNSAGQNMAAIEYITEAEMTASHVHPHRFELNINIQLNKARILSAIPERLEDAASAYKTLVYQSRTALPGSHTKLVWARRHYATVLCQLGRFQEAESLSRENVDICKHGAGEKSVATCDALTGLAHVLSWTRPWPSNMNDDGPLQQESTRVPANFNEAQQERNTRLSQSLEILESVLSIYKGTHGENSDQIIRASSEIANFFKEQGDYAKALKIYQDVRAKSENLRGFDHPGTLTHAHEEADLLRLLFWNDEAERLTRKVWLARKSVLGAEDLMTMSSKNNLALCLRKNARPEEARQLDQELYEEKTSIYGSDHLETAHTMNNLAMDYYDLRVFDEAEKLLSKVIVLREEKLGPAHDGTLSSRSNLAAVLMEQGNQAAAEATFREIFDRKISLHGPIHQSTIESGNLLSSCLQRQGKSEDAHRLLENLLSHLRNELSPTHPRILSALRLLANSHVQRKEYIQAEPLYRELIDLSHDVTIIGSKAKFDDFGSFAFVLNELRKFPQAEKLRRRALKGQQVILGTEHKTTLLSAGNLAACLIVQEKFSEAESLCRETIILHEAILGNYHLQTIFVLRLLASMYSKQERTVEYVKLLEVILKRIEENRVELAECHGPVLQSLIIAYYSAADWTQTRRHLARYLEIMEAAYGCESIEAGAVLRQMGVLEDTTANFHDAVSYYRKLKQLYETLNKTADENDFGVISSLSQNLMMLNETKEASTLLKQAMELNGKLSSTSPSKARPSTSFVTCTLIGNILFRLDRLTECEIFLSAVIEEGSKTLPPDHSAILGCRRTLARVIGLKPGREGEAVISIRDGFHRHIEDKSTAVQLIPMVALHLGEMCGRAGKFWEGEIVLRGAWNKLKVLFGEENSRTLEARRQYVVLLARAHLSKNKT